MAYKRKYKPRRGKTNKRYRSSKRMYKSSVAKAVKTVLSRQMETKMNQFTSGNVNIYQTITNNEVVNLIPAITQGVGQADRVGNRISPRKFTVKMVIFCNNMNGIQAGASSSYFDIYFFRYKAANLYYAGPTASDMTKFLQDDNGSNQYNGEVLDGIRPVNADIFQLLIKKRIMLNNIYNTTLVNMTGYYQNASPQRTLTFDLTKHIKKHWMYDDTNINPVNDNLYVAIGSTQTDGTGLGATIIGTYRFISDFRYKDA